MRRTALLVAVVVTSWFVGQGSAFAASELSGPPDSDGHYAHCSVNMSGTTGTVDIRVSCQTSGPVGLGGQSFTLYWRDGANTEVNTTMNAGTYVVDANAAGRFRIRKMGQALGAGGYSASNTQASTSGLCVAYVNGAARTKVQCGVVLAAVGSDYPAYPEDYWPGGSPGGTALSACISFSPVDPNVGETVIASSCSSGDPTSWSWTFPSGTPSTGSTASVAVTWSTEGTYAVSLTVGDGTTTATRTENLTVGASGGGGCSILDLGCWVQEALTFLFIPDDSHVDDFTGLGAEITDKLPFSVVYDVVTYIPHELSGMLDGLAWGIDNNLCITAVGDSGLLGDDPFSGTSLESSVPHPYEGVNQSVCSDTDVSGTGIDTVRVIILAGVLFSFALSVFRSIGSVIGGGAPEGASA